MRRPRATIFARARDVAIALYTVRADLGEVLSELFQRYPALKEQISTEGGLSRFINVYVNDQDIRYLQGLETQVGPGDTVVLLPAMAGGC